MISMMKFVLSLAAVPDAPHSLEATNVTKSEATITWQAPVNDGGVAIEGYHVERCSDSGSRWVRQTRAPVTELSYHADNLMEGTEYQYRIIAVNKRGESAPSEATTPFVATNPYGIYLTNENQQYLLNCYEIVFWIWSSSNSSIYNKFSVHSE